MEFHECSSALAVLRAHLKEEALDSEFPQPVKGTAVSEDLHTGQTHEEAVSSKSSCHGYTPALLHLCPAEKLFALGSVLHIALANKFLYLLITHHLTHVYQKHFKDFIQITKTLSEIVPAKILQGTLQF